MIPRYRELAQPADTPYLRRYAGHSTHRLCVQRHRGRTERACVLCALPAHDPFGTTPSPPLPPRPRPRPPTPDPCPSLQRYGGGSAALQHSDEQCRHTRMAPSTALLSRAAAAARDPLGVLLAADGHREGICACADGPRSGGEHRWSARARECWPTSLRSEPAEHAELPAGRVPGEVLVRSANALPIAEEVGDEVSGALAAALKRRGGMQAVAHGARSSRARRPGRRRIGTHKFRQYTFEY